MNADYPDPTPEMLDGDPLFEAIWQAIKDWDISRHNDGMYSAPTGNDARHIYDAVRAALDKDVGALEAAALERAAKIADSFTCGICGMDGKAGAAIRAARDKEVGE